MFPSDLPPNTVALFTSLLYGNGMLEIDSARFCQGNAQLDKNRQAIMNPLRIGMLRGVVAILRNETMIPILSAIEIPRIPQTKELLEGKEGELKSLAPRNSIRITTHSNIRIHGRSWTAS